MWFVPLSTVLDAHVVYKTAMGITGVDYSAENGSKLVFATTK